MNALLALCLLVFCTTEIVSRCTNGKIEVSIDQPHFKAGRISICRGRQWRDICHHGWDEKEARVVCRELGFFEVAVACTRSCFGRTDQLNRRRTKLSCNGNERRLSECIFTDNSWCRLTEYAGILCYNSSSPPPITTAPTCPASRPWPQPRTTTHPTPPPCVYTEAPPITMPPCQCPTMEGLYTTSQEISNHSHSQTSSSTKARDGVDLAVASTKCPTGPVGAVLGAVSAFLLFTLVGVVMGWVWSYNKSKKKQVNEAHTNDFTNPTYGPTHISSTQYSSTGPRGTPTGHTPQQEPRGEEAVYQDVEQGEGVYHTLGEGQEGRGAMVYDVPMDAKTKVEEEYSTLHYH